MSSPNIGYSVFLETLQRKNRSKTWRLAWQTVERSWALGLFHPSDQLPSAMDPPEFASPSLGRGEGVFGMGKIWGNDDQSLIFWGWNPWKWNPYDVGKWWSISGFWGWNPWKWDPCSNKPGMGVDRNPPKAWCSHWNKFYGSMLLVLKKTGLTHLNTLTNEVSLMQETPSRMYINSWHWV